MGSHFGIEIDAASRLFSFQALGCMFRSLLVMSLISIIAGCAPPRWSEPLCRGQPETWNLDERALADQLDRMSDEQLLDLAACNMATSHPSTYGFPDHFVTQWSSSMAASLLGRIEARDDGLISMGYMSLLEEMMADNPEALSPQQRKSALAKCNRLYPQAQNACKSF